jgi:carbonic anhydrase
MRTRREITKKAVLTKRAAPKNASGAWAVFFLFAICALGSSQMMAQEHHADPAHSWTYTGEHGPEHWGDLSPEFAACATGKAQSPIDITSPSAAQLSPIHFAYHTSPLKIINNGHTIQINYAPGSSISVDGKTYELLQFHFHHPSEEEISGKRYAMVAHLVHKNNQGKLAVVAVLIEEGDPNQLISTLWDNLPTEKGQEQDLHSVELNVTDLLPSNKKYYTFVGSLTTPPCTEGVTWYVLETPVTLSKAQIDKFASIYPLNARPVQPVHNRVVQESK